MRSERTLGRVASKRNERGTNMKPKALTCMIVVILLALVTVAGRLPAGSRPQDTGVRYSGVKLNTLGGMQGGANSINNRGWVTGLANPVGDQTAHATLWLRGQ